MHRMLVAASRRSARASVLVLLTLALTLAFAFATPALAAPIVASPRPTAGATGLLPGPTGLSVQSSDTRSLLRSSTLLLDGVVVPSTMYFADLWEYDPEIDEDVLVGEDRLHAQLYAAVQVGFGTHLATARVYNSAGELTTYSWSFTVLGSDTIDSISPADASYTANRSPMISARVTSSSSATPAVVLDGTGVTPSSYSGGIVRYQTSNLTDDAWHTATVRGLDGVTAAMSNFRVHTGAPVFSAMNPTTVAPSEYPNPLVSAMVADSIPLSAPGVGAVTLDGNVVPFTFTPRDVGKLRAEMRVATGGLSNGAHSVSMTVANAAGTPTTKTWAFTVAVAPTISALVPAASSTVVSATPLLSATIAENSVGSASGTFTVNGVAVVGVYDSATHVLSARPATPLADGAHTATVQVTDASGVSASATWSFRTSALPPMPTGSECSSCHSGYPAAHGPSICLTCHEDFGTAPVGWDGTEHPSNECTWCHSYANSPAVPFHPEAHDTSQDVSTCTGCHSAELTTEHFRRTDDLGDPLTCAACHESTDPGVSAAIAAGDTACGSCHVSGTGHAFAHGSEVASVPLGASGFTCGQCHEVDVLTEHFKATSSSAVSGCTACHPSPRSTLAPWGKSCSQGGCHPVGTAQEVHASITASHSVLPANAGCQSSGCHQGTDLSVIHASAESTASGQSRTSCLICHADGVPASRDCTTCHTAAGVDFHVAQDASHTSPTDSACFGAGCHDASKKLPEVHERYVGAGARFSEYDTSCDLCHANSNPDRIDWSVAPGAGCTGGCHAAPNHSQYSAKHAVSAASSGCTSAACHGSDLADIHGANADAARCGVCHDDNTNWSKTAECVSCHDTGAPHGALEVTHATLPANAACATVGCHDAGNVAAIHSDAATTVAGVTRLACRVCHPVGGPAPASKDCQSCHPEMTTSHYNPVTHTATPGSATYVINGVTYTSVGCTSCHTMELGAEHDKPTASTAGRGCSTCHPEPRRTLAPWGKSCAQGGCHTAGSADPQHSMINPVHALPGVTPSCLTAGCHVGGDLAAVHSNASTTTAEGTMVSCLVCHGTGALPSGQCSNCHNMASPHPNETSVHAVPSQAGWVTVFEQIPDHDFTEWYVQCTDCHETANLLGLHNNNCATCHAIGGPASSFTTSTYTESGAVVDGGFETGTDGATLGTGTWTVSGAPQRVEYDNAQSQAGAQSGWVQGPSTATYAGVLASAVGGMTSDTAETRFWLYFDSTNQFRQLDDLGSATTTRTYTIQFSSNGTIYVYTNRAGSPNGYTTTTYVPVGTYSTGWTEFRIVTDFTNDTYTLSKRSSVGGAWVPLKKAGNANDNIPMRGTSDIMQSNAVLFRAYQNANMWIDNLRYADGGITDVLVPGAAAPWNKTCQQGACHPSYHDAVQSGHVQQLTSACENCHNASFEVDCQRCH